MRYEKLGFEIASLLVASDENTLYCLSPKNIIKRQKNYQKLAIGKINNGCKKSSSCLNDASSQPN